MNNIVKAINIFKSSSDCWLYILIGCIWAYPLLVLFNAIVLRMPSIDFLGPYMKDIITFIVAFFALKALYKRILLSDLLLYLGFLIIYLFQYILYPENIQYLDEYAIEIFLNFIPLFFVGICIDINKLDKYLYTLSILCLCFFVYHDLVFARMTTGDMEDYDMGSSYQFMPFMLYIIWYSFRNFKLYQLFILGIGFLLQLSYGTRGPLVCIFVFISLYILLFARFKNKSIFIFCILCLGYIIITFLEPIVLFLSEIISNLGMSNRVLIKLIENEILEHDSRNVILDTIERNMENSDLFGFGLFGSWRFVNIYTHRIYWDFWFSFGYLFGTIFMMLFVWIYYKGFNYSRTDIEKGFWLLLIIGSLVHLMFSQFFLTNRLFWILLGYCFGRMRNICLK